MGWGTDGTWDGCGSSGSHFIFLIVWLLVRAGRNSNQPAQHGESPEETLKRRYANGEISQEDYQRMLNEIRR